MSPEVPSFAPHLVDSSRAATRLPGAPGLSLRHLATLLLMLLVLPVFAVSALVALPVAVVGALAEAARRSWAATAPARTRR